MEISSKDYLCLVGRIQELEIHCEELGAALELLALKTDWDTCPFCAAQRPSVPGPKSPSQYTCLEHRHFEYLVNKHHPVA